MDGYILRSEAGKEASLSPQEFISISQANAWGLNKNYDLIKVKEALEATFLTITIRNSKNELCACLRALSDDLFFTSIPDIFVLPELHRKGLGTWMMEELKKRVGHTAIFFGAQPGNEAFFEALGFEKGIQSYQGKFR